MNLPQTVANGGWESASINALRCKDISYVPDMKTLLLGGMLASAVAGSKSDEAYKRVTQKHAVTQSLMALISAGVLRFRD